MLTFDRLCLLLGSVSLLSCGQGRRIDKAGGEGPGPRGRRGGGLQLTEGYKYLAEPDDRTVSHLETDGRALAGHLATLTLWRQKQTAPPTAPRSVMMLVAASSSDTKPKNLITICQNC